ncbi:hypothetical protein J4558_01170 [Leptolyngbya sp. 15MV]|nr:hypothetical protein J4558_01170 [Leptolyngbya sp. 15MV]
MTDFRTRLTDQPRSSSRVDAHPARNAPRPDPAKAIARGTASSIVVS